MKKAFTTLLLGCSLFMCGLLPFDGAFQVAAAAEVDESKIDGLKCFIMVRKDVKGKKSCRLQGWQIISLLFIMR